MISKFFEILYYEEMKAISIIADQIHIKEKNRHNKLHKRAKRSAYKSKAQHT